MTPIVFERGTRQGKKLRGMCVPASRQCVLRCEKTHTCKAPTLSSREQTRVKRPVVTHHSAYLSEGKASPKRKGSPARPGWGLHADEETNKSASKNMQTPRFRLQTTHHACPRAGQLVLQASLHITHDFLATFPTCGPTDPIPVKQHQTRWDGYTQTQLNAHA